ncbi:MAG: radical SAM protein [Gammaproteobacteria bacterium]|nr:radical SAM protein [Gammaproteobacteria bacterium]
MNYTLNRIKQGLKNSYWSRTYTPTDAIIFLTYRCTSRCKACNIWQRKVKIDDELTWDQWKPILANLAENNIRSIELFGGDALLRKDLLINMIRYCTDNNIYTFFPTNSSSLTNSTITDLVDAGLGTIYFSLDEVPSINEPIRGVKRHFERVTTAIRTLKKTADGKKGPRIVCITTVSSMNYKYLRNLIDVAFEMGADEYEIHGISEFTSDSVKDSAVNGILPDPYFMPTDDKSHAFTLEQATELLTALKQIRREKDRYSPMSITMENLDGLTAGNLTELHYPHQTCLFATTQVVISPFGDVQPCLYYKDYQLGNMRNRDLADIWGNEKHRRFCEQQQRELIPLCNHCGNKYYHKPFIPLMKDVTREIVRKIART